MNETYSVVASIGTTVIADVFDALGHTPPILDNRLSTVGKARSFAGPAYTISGEPALYTGGDRAKLAAIDNMPAGVVAVWASGDAEGVCCFGDLLASSMFARGCVGAVVDGGVRDVSYLENLAMPVVSRYRTPAQGIGRWRVTSSQAPVRVRGALTEWLSIEPGDAIVSDSDGVIVIPTSLLDEVASKAAAWAQSDTNARNEILGGLPLLSALAKYGHL
ncbi:RraA family protein [Granulicella sp. 5B5]|uniref:RraA family protein n=1 Tax=Granulicella sp. 5B5 TaxID=1617967 RepID=UPI0015F4CB9D|nr:RraA family protein [Granulicella sp. 5B5]QMV17286.1 RraA family protein [Granulicella sp. 5B5]